MRVLIVSFFFPPYNASGSVRVGKTAQYLSQFGHDVRVVTAKDQPLQPSLPLEFPPDRIKYTRWFNVNKAAELAVGGRSRVATKGYAPAGPMKGVLSRIGLVYKSLLNVPDGKIGWVPFAVGASLRIVRAWKPDLLYTSGMPFSAHLVGHLVSKRCGVPWIAEMRDLFVDDHYYVYPAWRRRLDNRLEQRVLSTASGLVTVSEPLAEVLRQKYGKPTAVVLNGFAPEDYPACAKGNRGDCRLRIVYTGTLTGLMYDVKRDPSPLFQALRILGKAAENVRVAFYGRDAEAVKEIAKRQGVEHLVELQGQVPHRTALQVQAEADILLLLLWNTPEERGVYTGKLFEYIGARRPILAIGPLDNVAADLIREREAGVVISNPELIAAQLTRWLRKKEETGLIPPLSESAPKGLSRREQTEHLERFMLSVVEGQAICSGKGRRFI